MPTFNEEAFKKWKEQREEEVLQRKRKYRAKYRSMKREEARKYQEQRQRYYQKNREKILEQKRKQRRDYNAKINGLKITKGEYVVHFE